MVEVAGDLLGPVARRQMLGAVQRCTALLGRELQEVGGDQRDRAPRALLPRRVGSRLHDDLAHDARAGNAARFTAAPTRAPRRRLDETRAARQPRLKWEPAEYLPKAAE